MKKGMAAFLAGLFLAHAAFASDDMKARGTVIAIDLPQSTMTVQGFDGKNYVFTVNAGTEIERERDFWPDTKMRLDEVKTGDRVKVEFYGSDMNAPIAKEIDVK